MASERFTYQVVDLKATLWGLKAQRIQDELNRLGQQGWELVSTQTVPGHFGVRLFLKKTH